MVYYKLHYSDWMSYVAFIKADLLLQFKINVCDSSLPGKHKQATVRPMNYANLYE